MADVWDRARLVIVPLQLAVGQDGHEPIGGGGFEDVTREITQGVLARTRGLATDVPVFFPNRTGDLIEEFGMFLGVIAVGEGRTVWTLKQLSAQSRGAATQDFPQNSLIAQRAWVEVCRASCFSILRCRKYWRSSSGEIVSGDLQ